jgi:hypothetical protein
MPWDHVHRIIHLMKQLIGIWMECIQHQVAKCIHLKILANFIFLFQRKATWFSCSIQANRLLLSYLSIVKAHFIWQWIYVLRNRGTIWEIAEKLWEHKTIIVILNISNITNILWMVGKTFCPIKCNLRPKKMDKLRSGRKKLHPVSEQTKMRRS